MCSSSFQTDILCKIPPIVKLCSARQTLQFKFVCQTDNCFSCGVGQNNTKNEEKRPWRARAQLLQPLAPLSVQSPLAPLFSLDFEANRSEPKLTDLNHHMYVSKLCSLEFESFELKLQVGAEGVEGF
ncbi:unnamed protein product [Cuscuta europaea]|uniref:Uncharacterized protein n=1 Tax=Cuscuta europaea TaxID=41803 RepID=A0A9P0YT61_CUSEU|nr:unnamed protein product [Cuscuta europaea]